MDLDMDVDNDAIYATFYLDNDVKPSLSDLEEKPKLSTSDSEEKPIIKRRMHTNEVLKTYNLMRLAKELGTREQAVAFAEDHGLILKSKECKRHKKLMNIGYSRNKAVGSFSCSKASCRGRAISRATNTCFSNTKLSLPHVFYLIYCFAHRWSYDMVVREDIMREEHCLSSRTIADWYGLCREVVVIYQLDQTCEGKIGGPGKVVQIEQCQFGKRKQIKGNIVEGHWVLGLIDDESQDLRLEVCSDNDRSADVLVPLIQKHVEAGTTIHTNSWSVYDCLSDFGYIHKRIKESVDPSNPEVGETKAGTHRIKSQWRFVKNFFAQDNYNHPEDFADLCVEYLWRRSLQRHRKDPFIELIKAVKYVYDPYKPKK